jgi:hypothetical protein
MLAGGVYGQVELWLDGVLLGSAALESPLPDPIHVFVAGRSVGIRNLIDNIRVRQSILREDWEERIDPTKWMTYGDSSPQLVSSEVCSSGTALDPKGCEGCHSGVWTVAPVVWGPGCVLGLDFVTDAHHHGRSLQRQTVSFGFTGGWETTGACAYSAVKKELYVNFSLDEGPEEPKITLSHDPIGKYFECSYPPSEDGICHHVELRMLAGRSHGQVELWYDGMLLHSAHLQAPLGEPLHVFVDGTSTDLRNIIDNIYLRK